MGHDAHVILVRHQDDGVGVRARGVHRDVPLDRSRTRSVRCPADKPRLRRRDYRADARGPARVPRRVGRRVRNLTPLVSRIGAANLRHLRKLRHGAARRAAAALWIRKWTRRCLSVATSAGAASLSRSTRAATLARSTRAAALTWTTGAARTARSLLPRDENKLPLVVMVAPVVKTDRRRLALARDADDHALHTNRAAGLRSSARQRLRLLPTRGCPARRRSPSARLVWLRSRGRGVRADEIQVLPGDWVLVLLPKEFLLDQDIQARRNGSRPRFSLEEIDRSLVLLAPEDELCFLLANRRL